MNVRKPRETWKRKEGGSRWRENKEELDVGESKDEGRGWEDEEEKKRNKYPKTEIERERWGGLREEKRIMGIRELYCEREKCKHARTFKRKRK